MISVLVAARSPVTRAGLKSMVEQIPECTVAGSASEGDLIEHALELNPDAILWQVSDGEDIIAALHALSRHNTIVLSSQSAFDLIRAGARGVLPADASYEQIGIALRAAAAGLGVFSPEYLVRSPVITDAPVLTAREIDVLRMISEGLANKEIAYRLGISDHTVKFHVSALLGKLGAASRAEAVSAGVRKGLIMV